MEQNTNTRLDADVDDWQPPAGDTFELDPSPLLSTRLVDDAAASQTPLRVDGWTPDRIRTFLAVLSRCGVVGDAARAAGISRQAGYALRHRAEGRAFALAWDAAMLLARRRLADDLYSRAVHGSAELIVRDGKIVAERHRFDNRLGMALLTRLDQQARAGSCADETVVRVAEEFDDFVEIVCDGGRGAADFIGERKLVNLWRKGREAKLLDKGARRARTLAARRRRAQGG